MTSRGVTFSMCLVFAIACGGSGSPAPAPAPAATASTPVAAPGSGPIVRQRVGIGETFIPQTGDEALRAFVPEIEADEIGGECSLARTDGSGATIVTAFYPTRTAVRMQVAITFDSGGRLVRYSERRGVPHFLPMRGATPQQMDSLIRTTEATVRSTTIGLDYAIDQAVVSNRGGGKPTVAVLGTVRAVEKLDKLGPPAARLERMRKLCGV